MRVHCVVLGDEFHQLPLQVFLNMTVIRLSQAIDFCFDRSFNVTQS